MSDTITCPNCTATLPSAASFCTSCGTRLAQAPPAPSPADPTQVGTPGLQDPTQVFSPPASSTPWQPAPGDAPPPPPIPAGGWAPPPPPGAPPASPPTTDQQPAWVQAAQSLSSTPPPAAGWGTTPEPQAPRPAPAGSPLGAALALLGGVLTLVAIFLPWVTSNLSDAGLSGWDLTSGDKGFRLPDGSLLTFESLDPYALLIIAAAGIFTGIMAFGGNTRGLSRVLGVVLGVAVIGFMVRDWTSMADVVKDKAPADFRIESAIGFYLALAGGALLAVSAAMPNKSPATAPAPEPGAGLPA